MMVANADFAPIEDYFLIGDLRTAALVSNKGSIDWLCLPYFDSASIFGKLLDTSAGCLAIDMPGYKIKAAYVQDTAIVEFNLSHADVKLSIRDFMVPQPTKTKVNQWLVRSVSAIHGSANVKFKFQPQPNYNQISLPIDIDNKKLKITIDGGTVVLHLPKGSRAESCNKGYQIFVPIQAGDKKDLMIEYVAQNRKLTSSHADLEQATVKFWKHWVKKGSYVDFCHKYLVRSAITLKLMQFYPTGAIVAAPTTSLPEDIGGVRNWDYRYSWIRDATFALYAFYVLGYDQEAEHFFSFIEKVTEQCAEDKFDVSLMYTIWGEPVPKERSIKQLTGYKNSKPVRVGNDASRQFQLDVFGSLIDAFYFATKHKLAEINKQKWRKLVMQLVRKIDKLWQEPDHGIWEARIGRRHYTYSKVMAWVGADRANRLKKTLDLTDDDLQICTRLSASIKQWVWENGYKQQLQNFTQHSRTQAIDATNLLFVLLQFLDKHEPQTRNIIDNTAKQLSHGKVFIYRYRQPDGLPGDEGAFMLCSYWLVSALAILEDVKPAVALFKQLESYMNPQGLLAEETDPKTKSYLGNYPQAFSHLGYIMSAHYINKYAKRQNIKL